MKSFLCKKMCLLFLYFYHVKSKLKEKIFRTKTYDFYLMYAPKQTLKKKCLTSNPNPIAKRYGEILDNSLVMGYCKLKNLKTNKQKDKKDCERNSKCLSIFIYTDSSENFQSLCRPQFLRSFVNFH